MKFNVLIKTRICSCYLIAVRFFLHMQMSCIHDLMYQHPKTHANQEEPNEFSIESQTILLLFYSLGSIARCGRCTACSAWLRFVCHICGILMTQHRICIYRSAWHAFSNVCACMDRVALNGQPPALATLFIKCKCIYVKFNSLCGFELLLMIWFTYECSPRSFILFRVCI